MRKCLFGMPNGNFNIFSYSDMWSLIVLEKFEKFDVQRKVE